MSLGTRSGGKIWTQRRGGAKGAKAVFQREERAVRNEWGAWRRAGLRGQVFIFVIPAKAGIQMIEAKPATRNQARPYSPFLCALCALAPLRPILPL